MTTPVHLSGPRPSTASSAPSNSSANSSAQSASQTGNGGGSQAAMFDLLFALQLGAGGWEGNASGEPALIGEESESTPDPALLATAAEPAATTSVLPTETPPVTDPAALLWNPFSERNATAEAAPGASEPTADAIVAADDAGKGRGSRGSAMLAARPDAVSGQALNADSDKVAASHAEGAPSEYSQLQTDANRESRSTTPAAPVHAQATSTTTAPAPTAVASLDAPMGTPAFREQLASQIAVFIDQKQLSAQIQVHPPELGPVDVEIKIKADAVDVGFFATQADARDALELAIPQLKEMLAEQGLSLGSAHVGTRDDPRGFADTLQDGWRGSGRRDASASANAGTDSAGSAESAEPVPLTIRRSLRLVDTFA